MKNLKQKLTHCKEGWMGKIFIFLKTYAKWVTWNLKPKNIMLLYIS